MRAMLSPAHGLALVRMGVGLYFLAEGSDKLSHGWLTNGQPLQRMLQSGLRRAWPWYAGFLQQTVLRHVALFARLVTLGELLVGISLLLGLLTPTGAAGAIWLNLNYMLQSPWSSLIAGRNRLFILCAIVLLLCSAGATWSLDSLLLRAVKVLRRAPAAPTARDGPAN